jgi:hypothetical protein
MDYKLFMSKQKLTAYKLAQIQSSKRQYNNTTFPSWFLIHLTQCEEKKHSFLANYTALAEMKTVAYPNWSEK